MIKTKGLFMRSQRWLGVLAAAAGMTLLNTSPATAALPTVNWKAVSTNSNWHCGAYTSPANARDLNFKPCWVVNANNDAQAVLVVQNPSNQARTIKGAIRMPGFAGEVNCAETVLNPGFTRGCYSITNACAGSTGPLDVWLFVRDEWGEWAESINGIADQCG
ncbi:hypothetical protein [Streptomyces cadmiisoli]|uniref:hypothetical protein n=1 Tax=Streptomyces cadmiisoli TaxID=2184053 RepID=UPI0036583899